MCEFKVGNINESIEIEKNYDIVIFRAVEDVLGSAEETADMIVVLRAL